MISCRHKSFRFVIYYRHIPCSNISAFVYYYTHIPHSSVLVNYYKHIPCSGHKVFIKYYRQISRSDPTLFPSVRLFVTIFFKVSNIALCQLCLELISYECLNLHPLSSVNQNAYWRTQRLLSLKLAVVTCTAYPMPVNGKHVD